MLLKVCGELCCPHPDVGLVGILRADGNKVVGILQLKGRIHTEVHNDGLKKLKTFNMLGIWELGDFFVAHTWNCSLILFSCWLVGVPCVWSASHVTFVFMF